MHLDPHCILILVVMDKDATVRDALDENATDKDAMDEDATNATDEDAADEDATAEDATDEDAMGKDHRCILVLIASPPDAHHPWMRITPGCASPPDAHHPRCIIHGASPPVHHH